MKVEYEIVPQLNNKKPDDVLSSLDVIEESKAGILCANVKWLNFKLYERSLCQLSSQDLEEASLVSVMSEKQCSDSNHEYLHCGL